MFKSRLILLATLILTVTLVGCHDRKETKNNELPLNAKEQRKWSKVLYSYDYAAIAAAYADYMIEHGRDRYGEIHSPLFVSAMDRKTVTVFKHGNALYPHVITKPYSPGLRRDHKMRPTDRTYSGGNPMEDLPLYNLLYRLSDLTGQEHYAEEADKSIAWFLENGQSPVTGLYCWGSHLYWDVHKDQPIYGNTGSPDGGYGGHEYGNDHVWTRWEQNPGALTRFAHGIWEHQITDQETGRFSRHADYHQHNPGQEWYDFPGIASAFIEAWSREYGANGHPDMKLAIQTLLEHYRSMRHPETGAMSWCTAEGPDRREVSNVGMNLYMATNVQDGAALVENRDPELAREMREFVMFMDDEYLSNDYDKILDVADKGILSWYTIAERICMPKGLMPPPEGVDASVGFPLKNIDGTPAASLYYMTPWFPGRSYAEFSLLLRDRYKRCETKHKPAYRQALLDIAEIYMSISPEVQFAQYPDNISDVVELLRFVYKLTDDIAYLHRADQMMRLGLQLFFDETSPLPKITNFDDWYESSTKNESSVEILSQMLELSLDLENLPEEKRTAPQVPAQEQLGKWYAELNTASTDVILHYGENKAHGLYLFQTRNSDQWKVSLSDVISRIPSIEEADELNGRMDKFTGKGNATTNITYGGFKDVPRQVTLVIHNTGKKEATVYVAANLHDTYHDNGQVQNEKTLKPGEEGAFVLNASSLKWIRSLLIKSSNNVDSLQLKSFAFEMVPRSKLTQTKKEALVFLIAGQSNAGGVAAFSPETNEMSGMAEKHPTIPGSTAKEVGIPTNNEAYPKSYIWKPGKEGPFEPLTPGVNLLGGYNGPNRHGIELPMAMILEKQYPDLDKFFVKHGPAGHNLHTQWAAKQGPDYVAFISDYRAAMSNLEKRYDKVRIIGLYWDQGESDQEQALLYEKNLCALFAALREDIGIPDLQIYVRKHLFQHDIPDFKPVIDAQVKVTKEDNNAYLLDLDLGSNELNFKAWAWTDNNGHLSSKAYLELSRRIMALPVQELRKEWGPFVGPWERHDKNPIIGLEDKETYSIQNGPQSVVRWKDKWYMFLMTSQPMVTKLAVSDDGLTWHRPHHEYLLEPEMEWEGSYNLAKAAVVRDDEVWLYYFGKKDKSEMIALARSKDLVNWQKEPKPIFTYKNSRLDGDRAFPDCVIKEGDTWYMYYDVGFDYDHPKRPDGYVIGIANSKDGINWTDSPKSPVLTTSERNANSWDDGMVSQCSVHIIGEWYYMLYSGSTNNYGREHSGKNRMAFGLARAQHPEGPWEKYPHNPVFKPSSNEEDFDGVFLQHPCPVKVGNQWRLYYNGWTKKKDAKNSIGAEYGIGVAFVNE